jgi:hypothetical protein
MIRVRVQMTIRPGAVWRGGLLYRSNCDGEGQSSGFGLLDRHLGNRNGVREMESLLQESC